MAMSPRCCGLAKRAYAAPSPCASARVAHARSAPGKARFISGTARFSRGLRLFAVVHGAEDGLGPPLELARRTLEGTQIDDLRFLRGGAMLLELACGHEHPRLERRHRRVVAL